MRPAKKLDRAGRAEEVAAAAFYQAGLGIDPVAKPEGGQRRESRRKHPPLFQTLQTKLERRPKRSGEDLSRLALRTWNIRSEN
jgi:hypothetical protein